MPDQYRAMRNVFITGANRGLGLGLARHYAAQGWTVFGGVRDPASADRLKALPGDVRIVVADLDRLDQFATLAAQIPTLDVLISNAAMTGGPLGSFGSFDTSRFLDACRINAAAPMLLLEAFAGPLAAAQGTALMISSRLGAVPFYGYAEYFASKTALNAIVKQASIALAKMGVVVVAAHPGWVETEATAGQGKAPLGVDDAAALLAAIVDRATIDDAGKFFDPDGSELPIVPQQMEVKFYSKPRGASR